MVANIKNSPSLYAVIMAGGEGARFYPLSTPERPKQFLNFIGDKSFLRHTFDRIEPIIPLERVFVSTNDRYGNLVREQVPGLPPANIIAEPFKKNTAPALAYAACVIAARDRDAIMCCLPSDHHIQDEAGLRDALLKASGVAGDGYLVILGMKPSWPSTEYGYICPKGKGEWSEVKRFVEKPDTKTAERYIKEGYLWNAGIFVWRAETFLAELKKCAPELAQLLKDYEDGQEFCHHFFEVAPSQSVDCAVMEKSDKVAVIEASIGWSDVGSWESIRRLKEDGVEISLAVLSVMEGDEISPWRRIVPKPWGHEEIWAHTPSYVGKILFIRKGNRLSLQYHKVKEETLRLLSGDLLLEFDGKQRQMLSGDIHHVPSGAHHRMEAKSDCLVLEVSTPELDDVVRVADDYGR